MQIFTYVLKLCSVILQFLGIFDLARLICDSLRTFILLSLTEFQEKKILSGCFKFGDLNLKLTEVIEILKATAQRFGKSETAAFWSNENSLHYFTIFHIACTWVELLLSQYHSATVPPPPLPLSPPPGIIFHVKNVNDVCFIFSLLKYICRFRHLDFLDFEYFRRPQIAFLCFLWS